jgi:DMSO reductase family type II enzyme heme b subunit
LKGLRIGPFWRAIIVIAAAYLVFDNAFPPIMPTTLMITYMIITVLGVVVYYAHAEETWAEFKAPILAVLRDDDRRAARWALLTIIPLLIGLTVYEKLKPSFEPPLELRQIHPAPPMRLNAYDKVFDLTTLKNPIRSKVLKQYASDPHAAVARYQSAITAGSEVYYQNCFYCHGDLLNGQGPYSRGLYPLPADFQDLGTIAQLEESYVFWRITTGGAGLPDSGTPWNSAMPAWHEVLSEQEVWEVIMFLYDTVGQVPRIWDAEASRIATAMKNEIASRRDQMTGEEIYQFRCAMCHGEEGAADTSVAELLYPKPRDFTYGLFKYKTSPGELPPRDEDIFNAIKYGLEGTTMPGWSALLSDPQITSLIPIIKSFDTFAAWAPEHAADEDFDDDGRYLKSDYRVITEQEPTDGQISYTPESIALGWQVAEDNCKECHGEEGRGNITSSTRLEDDWGYRIWPRNLTGPWTWRATNGANRDETIRNIFTRATIGIPGSPMPALSASDSGEGDTISAEDRWHLANYVYSLREQSVRPGDGLVIRATEIVATLPGTVTDPVWDSVPATTLWLTPNVIKEERLFAPLNDTITVRVLYNDSEIAFLLDVPDRTDSRPGEPVSAKLQDAKYQMHSDAVAIQYPNVDAYSAGPAVEKPNLQHGDTAHSTTIWYWNAGSVDPAVPARAMVLSGEGADKKPGARENSNVLTTAGRWQHGRWRVMMKRQRKAVEVQDVEFIEGRFLPLSFANWDGSNGEVGSRHTLTSWYWLLLPADTDYTMIYGIPAGATVGTLLLGLVLVRNQRRKRECGS